MCTVLLYRDSRADWPLLFAGNRDEMRDRPWRGPGRHWPDRPEVVAGIDELAGGSWLGLNDHGVLATVLNRTGSLGPSPNRRSRGELVLEALDHADAASAAAALGDLNPDAYRSFNLILADSANAFWVRNAAPDEVDRGLSVHEIPEGYSMFTAADRNDMTAPRIRTYLPQFSQALPPDPSVGNWRSWETLLAGRHREPGAPPSDALNIDTDTGFGTVSSSVIALPRPGLTLGAEGLPVLPVWRFAAGPPDRAPFEPVPLRPDIDQTAA